MGCVPLPDTGDTGVSRFGGQCGMCGRDWFFATREERQKWRDEHDPEHVGFMSFFKPSNTCPCGLKERPGSCGWCEE